MDPGDHLLGRLWMYVKVGIHQMQDNIYTFLKNVKEVTLYPRKSEPPKRGSDSDALVESFQVQHFYSGNANRT